MQKIDANVLYSASDLVNFLECEHLTALDSINLDTPLEKTEDSEEAKLIQAKGLQHEARFLDKLRTQHGRIVDIAEAGATLQARVDATTQAMRDGSDIIFQATLRDDCLIGHADFLRKVSQPSLLGDYNYEVLDTKLARSTKGKFIIQLGFYSALVAKVQGVEPRMMHVVLGDESVASYRCAEYGRYISFITRRFLERVNGDRVETYPDPCEKCAQCRWQGLCEQQRISDDHLSQVANISKVQVRKLQGAGIETLEALASVPDNSKIPKMVPETLDRLRHQAALQFKKRQTGENHLELLPVEADVTRGFMRLPQPDPGDLFFDMEGNPLEEGGLEYLFGLYFFDDGKPEFRAFWAHSRAEEKRAFEAFMNLVTERLARYPNAHIYHYAHYEETALKRLMSLHGTREAEVDNLLRRRKLVDLYKVVREALRVSEPKYSIKNIEHFYLESRTGEVTTAGASIVFYEKWKETGRPQLLEDIERYNFDDVRSTFALREWLLSLRPAGLAWANVPSEGTSDGARQPVELTEDEKRLIPYREALLDALPEDRTAWGTREHLQEVTYQLLDFHRRAAKPEWWAMFARMEMSEEEIIDDNECIGGLTLDAEYPPRVDKRSMLFTCSYPEQETKLKSGDSVTLTHSGEPVREFTTDPDTRRVCFKRSIDKDPVRGCFSLGPGAPITTKPLKEALFRFADSIICGSSRYPAIESVLNQDVPTVEGRMQGQPIVPPEGASTTDIVEAVASLNQSHIFIQGPPGAGKTYAGSHVIVALMKRGFRVGVSSNSHKAINNLLSAIEQVAQEEAFTFVGVKKSTQNTDSGFDGRFIENVTRNGDVSEALDNGALLVAGTAWLFADAELDQTLDYLFVDEAGQVALANLVAMGTSARNIVLLGDQMQLGQPIQGIHPGRSGESSLEYLLNGLATIPPERGIFLSTTWRMHPDVCRFISNAVYDGRLEAEPSNASKTLLLGPNAHPELRPAGIRYLAVSHEGCSQRSETEAEFVRTLVENLLLQRFRGQGGLEHPITLENILVVAPYNMQVNLLKQLLPVGARVGTVDKFQGQEAEVVIVSMATSSGDDLPRYIEFLYSKNRLNVAISRAKCLALFIANPALMAIRCTKPEEMALVNTLCWVRDYSQLSAAATV